MYEWITPFNFQMITNKNAPMFSAAAQLSSGSQQREHHLGHRRALPPAPVLPLQSQLRSVAPPIYGSAQQYNSSGNSSTTSSGGSYLQSSQSGMVLQIRNEIISLHFHEIFSLWLPYICLTVLHTLWRLNMWMQNERNILRSWNMNLRKLKGERIT